MYYFDCKCVSCTNNGLLDEMYGAKCSNLNCNGFINMYSIYDIESMKCSKCASNITEEAVEKYTQVEELSKYHLNNMKEVACILIATLTSNFNHFLFTHNITYESKFSSLSLEFDTCRDPSSQLKILKY